MFALNKESRKFLERKFIGIQNGFTNEGLITHQLKGDQKTYFDSITQIEERIPLYYE